MRRYEKAGMQHDCGYELYVDTIEKITLCPHCKVQIIPESMKR